MAANRSVLGANLFLILAKAGQETIHRHYYPRSKGKAVEQIPPEKTRQQQVFDDIEPHILCPPCAVATQETLVVQRPDPMATTSLRTTPVPVDQPLGARFP